MKMLARIVVAVLALLVFGCSRIEGQGDLRTVVAATSLGTSLGDNPVRAAAREPRTGFANLPDHGDLVAYPDKVVRHDGAYTWYRAGLSEEHALHAIADGHLRVTTPEGEILDFQYDRHVEHASGDWTWIGHRPGHEGEQTILTFGAEAAFGSIAQSGKPPLRLAVRDGISWLVETDPAKVARIVNAATRPQRPDYHIVPESKLPKSRSGHPRTAADATIVSTAASGATAASATTAAASTVDLAIGYTPGFASANGGTSGATTRLNYLVDVANAAYGNSDINAQVRVVKIVQVDYTETNSNETALEQLSGYKSGSGPITPDAAFDALRAAREQYGADLVTLVRDYQEPEQGGCGIAWLLGGSLQGIGAGEGWDELGYSVVGDGSDAGNDGKSYYCLDESLAHELGHNMGAAHDKETAKGDDGTLDNPDDYGAFTYSFGYKTGITTGNFYTIMAYGDTGQTIYRVFSSPASTFCGGLACGSASEDNTRTLNTTIPIVAAFRFPTTGNIHARNDFNGDGVSDLLWRNSATGANVIWNSANYSSQVAMATVLNPAWRIAGSGDFDGDRRADIIWRNFQDGTNVIWKSASASTQQKMETVTSTAWSIAGTGDFDGDGRSDVVWRNLKTGANTIWKSASSVNQQSVTGVTDQKWIIAGIADFDGDGRSDILWRNKGNGRNTIWKAADSGMQILVTTVSDQDWSVAGTGDFDGDSKSDILWRNAKSGASAIWKSASSLMQQSMTRVSDLDWAIAAIGDYDGDGRSDVVWRNLSSGSNTIWKSASYATQTSVKTVSDLRWSMLN
jgi:hypothetical protein